MAAKSPRIPFPSHTNRGRQERRRLATAGARTRRRIAAHEGLEVGWIDEAIAAATIEDNVYWRSDLLAQIAKARAAAGRINEAKQVAQYVTEGADRAAALTAVAADR